MRPVNRSLDIASGIAVLHERHQGVHRLKNDKNVRQQLGVSEDYVSYCGEERNFAAVLYHLLLDEKRLGAFLDLIDVSAPEGGVARVYFEYAGLRDLWAAESGHL